jgi:putative membrane protein
MSLLSKDECERIEAAIGELEKRTAAEIVVAVVGRSTHTLALRALLAFGAALASGFAFLELAPSFDARLSTFVELVVGFGSFALFGVGSLERLLVPREAARREVEAHAFALFARHGLYRTRSHTGVLLLVSELERHAVILGDSAIDARLGKQGWQAYIDHVVSAIRRGEPARGILEVLDKLGAALAEVAPPEALNDNELSNRVIQEP